MLVLHSEAVSPLPPLPCAPRKLLKFHTERVLFPAERVYCAHLVRVSHHFPPLSTGSDWNYFPSTAPRTTVQLLAHAKCIHFLLLYTIDSSDIATTVVASTNHSYNPNERNRERNISMFFSVHQTMPAPAPRSINHAPIPRSAVRTVPCINTNKHLFWGDTTEGEGGGGVPSYHPLSCVKVLSNAVSTVDDPQLAKRRRGIPLYVEDIFECLSGKTICRRLEPHPLKKPFRLLSGSSATLPELARLWQYLPHWRPFGLFSSQGRLVSGSPI